MPARNIPAWLIVEKASALDVPFRKQNGAPVQGGEQAQGQEDAGDGESGGRAPAPNTDQ